MGLFKKKPDPVSERARALNDQIADLESQIKKLAAEETRPTPLSPASKTVARVGATRITVAKISCIGELRPLFVIQPEPGHGNVYRQLRRPVFAGPNVRHVVYERDGERLFADRRWIERMRWIGRIALIDFYLDILEYREWIVSDFEVR